MVTSTIERQWYRAASRPMNSASPRVLPGFGSKQMTFVSDVFGGHGPPYPIQPCETTSTGARCCLASCRATPTVSPSPASITIASTCVGAPSAGHTNSRAVARQNATIRASTTINVRRPGRKDLRRRCLAGPVTAR